MPVTLTTPAGSQTADGYTDALTLGPTTQIETIQFTVANATVLAQVWRLNKAGKAILDRTEIPFAPGQWGLEGICGIRFRSAFTGGSAIVNVIGYFGDDAVPFGNATSAIGGLTQVTFSASGETDWEVPDTLNWLQIDVIGGGAGGGSGFPEGAGAQPGAGGGGSGAFSRLVIPRPSFFVRGTILNFNVGAGGQGGHGAGQLTGVDGGDSFVTINSLYQLILAKGGKGGKASSIGTGGIGGAASGNAVPYLSMAGFAGATSSAVAKPAASASASFSADYGIPTGGGAGGGISGAASFAGGDSGGILDLLGVIVVAGAVGGANAGPFNGANGSLLGFLGGIGGAGGGGCQASEGALGGNGGNGSHGAGGGGAGVSTGGAGSIGGNGGDGVIRLIYG